jgi:peptidyl-prolyl cis-trans isomerase A (cyclophilin A)
MIQGGDPMGNGQGGTDVIPDEIVPALKFDIPGRLAMANAGPKTGSCQFFITEVPTPHLNGQHTIFGQTVEGMGVVRTIARASAKATIKKIAFERVGPGPAVNPPAPAAAKKSAAPAKKAPAKK